MLIEVKYPEEVWCRDGYGCWHFLINDLCKELEAIKVKSREDIENFETKLGLLKAATAELEKMLSPFLEQNAPINGMPCRHPNTIAWGRRCYRKGLEGLRQTKIIQEEMVRFKKTKKKKIRKKK